EGLTQPLVPLWGEHRDPLRGDVDPGEHRSTVGVLPPPDLHVGAGDVGGQRLRRTHHLPELGRRGDLRVVAAPGTDVAGVLARRGEVTYLVAGAQLQQRRAALEGVDDDGRLRVQVHRQLHSVRTQEGSGAFRVGEHRPGTVDARGRVVRLVMDPLHHPGAGDEAGHTVG